MSVLAEPYTARRCPVCGEWVYCAAGPFSEGDPTKTLADYEHWEANHATPAERAAVAIGFPFFPWNEQPVDVRSAT